MHKNEHVLNRCGGRAGCSKHTACDENILPRFGKRVTKNCSAEKKRLFFPKSTNGLSYCMNDF